MKKILSLSFIVFALSSGIMAQKGFEVQKEITIDVSAEALWEMVGPGFIEVYKWSSNVDHATGKGVSSFEGAVCDERFCDVNVSGFSKISEKLTNYDEENMTLRYAVFHGMPGFVKKAENEWTVVAIDETHSKLVMEANFEVKGVMGFFMKGMMKGKMKKTLDTVLEDAKVYAETGQISSEKAKRVSQLEKKNRPTK